LGQAENAVLADTALKNEDFFDFFLYSTDFFFDCLAVV
jgi:hypothetical protein